jgi:hypothetical protein
MPSSKPAQPTKAKTLKSLIFTGFFFSRNFYKKYHQMVAQAGANKEKVLVRR